MAFKNYNIKLVSRLTILILVSIGVGWGIQQKVGILLTGLLVVTDIILLYRVIVFLNKINGEISFFIQSIKNEDNSLRFPLNSGNSVIDDLHNSLNELNNVLLETKVQSQIKEQYFSVILKNIETGIIVLTDKGFINDVNPSALDILGLKHLNHLKQIENRSEAFANSLKNIGNNQKVMLTYLRNDKQVQIITFCSEISLKNEKVKLITLQDIHGELEKKEVESWVKLIRVMNHEIMNSLAPVTSIAQSLQKIWNNKSTGNINEDDIESTIQGLEVITERGEALKKFVQSYRLLTQVPKVNKEKMEIHNFLHSLSILLSPFKEDAIDLQIKFPDRDFEVEIDRQLLVQVIINLVKNSMEALQSQENAIIEITTVQTENKLLKLEIIDNGPGIPKEVIDQVFIPFFTTKESGTGVGLSHSRQIIRAHGGTIECSSKPGKTEFIIIV